MDKGRFHELRFVEIIENPDFDREFRSLDGAILIFYREGEIDRFRFPGNDGARRISGVDFRTDIKDVRPDLDRDFIRILGESGVSVFVFRTDAAIEDDVDRRILRSDDVARLSGLGPYGDRRERYVFRESFRFSEVSSSVSCEDNAFRSAGSVEDNSFYIEDHFVEGIDGDDFSELRERGLERSRFPIAESGTFRREFELAASDPLVSVGNPVFIGIRLPVRQTVMIDVDAREKELILSFIAGKGRSAGADAHGWRENRAEPTEYRRRPFPDRDSFRRSAFEIRGSVDRPVDV